jgi:hypothetical protein
MASIRVPGNESLFPTGPGERETGPWTGTPRAGSSGRHGVRASRLPTAHRSTRTLLPRFAREIFKGRKEKILVAHHRRERGPRNDLARNEKILVAHRGEISVLISVDLGLGLGLGSRISDPDQN